MGFFSSTIETALAGREVRGAFLVRFDFASQSVWLWQGHGVLSAGGATWSGAGELGKIEGLESPLRGTSPVVTFTISGADPYLIAEALGNPAEYRDQPVTIFLQFFDADWAPLDSPYAVFVGVMDVLKVKTSGPGTRTIEVAAESLFTRRTFPTWDKLSDSSQQRLFPGDRALEFIPALEYQNVFWPPLFN